MAKILFVDDDTYFVSGYRVTLEDEGFEVVHESNATAGLQAYRAEPKEFAAILLDMAMDPGRGFPGLETRGGYHSGLSLAREIIRLNRHAPIIGITGYPDDQVRAWFSRQRLTLLDKHFLTPRRLLDYISPRSFASTRTPRLCFIVHGHDTGAIDELKSFIETELDGCRAVVLADEPSAGKTVIEKFEERAADAFAVFVLLTPDDMVVGRNGSPSTYRARQNVIFELGYFWGRRGRVDGKVIVLTKGTVEMPSDLAGIVRVDITKGIGTAGAELKRELQTRSA